MLVYYCITTIVIPTVSCCDEIKVCQKCWIETVFVINCFLTAKCVSISLYIIHENPIKTNKTILLQHFLMMSPVLMSRTLIFGPKTIKRGKKKKRPYKRKFSKELRELKISKECRRERVERRRWSG